MSSRRLSCLTKGGLLISSSASRPSNPFALVAKGMLWMAANSSSWIQVNQELVIGEGAADLDFRVWHIWTSSGQVAGALFGSRPAFCSASWLSQSTAVLELNGAEARRPSDRL